jgi:hypothetical protein
MTDKAETMTSEPRRLEQISLRESMRLLGTVSLGRVAFTARALPAIRPVNHLVDGDFIIIRTDGTAAITSTLKSEPDSVVVAYQADLIDYAEHLGWSVTIVGVARQVTDRDQAARYRRALRPWIAGEMDQVIAIHAELVTGFRLVGDHAGR